MAIRNARLHAREEEEHHIQKDVVLVGFGQWGQKAYQHLVLLKSFFNFRTHVVEHDRPGRREALAEAEQAVMANGDLFYWDSPGAPGARRAGPGAGAELLRHHLYRHAGRDAPAAAQGVLRPLQRGADREAAGRAAGGVSRVPGHAPTARCRSSRPTTTGSRSRCACWSCCSPRSATCAPSWTRSRRSRSRSWRSRRPAARARRSA